MWVGVWMEGCDDGTWMAYGATEGRGRERVRLEGESTARMR